MILRILEFWTLAKLHPDYGRKSTWPFCDCDLFEQVTNLKLKWPLTGGLKSSRIEAPGTWMSPKPPIFWNPLQNPQWTKQKRKGKKMVFSPGVFFSEKKTANFLRWNHHTPTTPFPPQRVQKPPRPSHETLGPAKPMTQEPMGLAYLPPFHWILVGEKKGDPYNGLLESQKKKAMNQGFFMSLMWLKSKVVVSKPFEKHYSNWIISHLGQKNPNLWSFTTYK